MEDSERLKRGCLTCVSAAVSGRLCGLMTHHAVDSHTIRRTIRLLERTWVGVADQDELFTAIQSLKQALTTPLNNDRNGIVITSAQRVSS